MYGNLIEVSVDTDTLDQRLADIDEKLANTTTLSEDDVQTLIRDALGGDGTLDEDRVNALIDERGFVLSDDLDDRVEQTARDLMHSEGDDFVQGVIDNGSYVTEYDLDDKLRELGDFATESDLSALDGRIDRVAHKLEQRVEELANADRTSEAFERLTQRVEKLEADRSRDGNVLDLLRQLVRALIG